MHTTQFANYSKIKPIQGLSQSNHDQKTKTETTQWEKLRTQWTELKINSDYQKAV